MSEMWQKAIGSLRYLMRKDEKVLQEMWINLNTAEKEWRDVPIVHEVIIHEDGQKTEAEPTE